MKASRTLTVFAVCLLALTASFAQSGRRIKTQPTPAPIVVSEEGYSESRPYKPVKIYPPNYKRPGGDEEERKKPVSDYETTDDPDVIKIEATLVTIPISVYDRQGLYIAGIRQEEVKIFEDGKEQEIAYFNLSDEPVTVALLLDTSPSTEFRIDDIRAAAKAFVRELNPEDSVLVAEFDGDVQVLTEVTRDRNKIFKAIDEADFGGGTALYDAVEFALTKRLNKIEGRKAIVLFTDGVDTVSRGADYGENLIDAEESEVVIFPIYYNTFLDNRMGGGGVMTSPFPIPSGGILNPQPRGTRPEDYALGKQYLEDLAAYTGGRVFQAGTSRFGLQSTFEAIAQELKRQYQVGYYPAEEGKPGDRKRIKVRVYRPDLIVRARDSYIVD
ncbi:MAG: VWA domain-containing protein [Acidobacteriota bacterium]|nr:MAG: VWA domain-containing protein [Acidobacteriota bacterium]